VVTKKKKGCCIDLQSLLDEEKINEILKTQSVYSRKVVKEKGISHNQQEGYMEISP